MSEFAETLQENTTVTVNYKLTSEAVVQFEQLLLKIPARDSAVAQNCPDDGFFILERRYKIKILQQQKRTFWLLHVQK